MPRPYPSRLLDAIGSLELGRQVAAGTAAFGGDNPIASATAVYVATD